MEFLSLIRGRSSARNVPSGKERGETDVFAGCLHLLYSLYWTIIQHPAKSGLVIFVMVKIFVFDSKSHVITYRVRVRFEITSTCMISDPNCTTRNLVTILTVILKSQNLVSTNILLIN